MAQVLRRVRSNRPDLENYWHPAEYCSTMVLSIVIVNWNTCDHLVACLQSIFASDFEPPMEVIVIDNASTDGSADKIANLFPQVDLIRSQANLGYAKGNNLGFERARGEFILALNPDTVLPPDTLPRAVQILGEKREVAVLAPRLIGPDGEVQRSIRGFPSMAGVLGDITGLGKLFPGSAFDSYRLSGFDYSKSQFAPQPMGTFLLFRRSALEAVGDPNQPFDELFPIFFNEVDLLKRLSDAGSPAWFEPSIEIRHEGGASTRQVRKNMIWESHRSLMRYAWKHWIRWWNWPLISVFSAAVYIGALVRARGFHAGFRP